MSTWLSKNSVIPQASSSRSWISSVFDFIWDQVSLFRLPNVSTRSMAPSPLGSTLYSAPVIATRICHAHRSRPPTPQKLCRCRCSEVTSPARLALVRLYRMYAYLLILSHLIFINCNRTHDGLARSRRRCGAN